MRGPRRELETVPKGGIFNRSMVSAVLLLYRFCSSSRSFTKGSDPSPVTPLFFNSGGEFVNTNCHPPKSFVLLVGFSSPLQDSSPSKIFSTCIEMSDVGLKTIPSKAPLERSSLISVIHSLSRRREPVSSVVFLGGSLQFQRISYKIDYLWQGKQKIHSL
jgi:hypothetical protein